MRGDKHLGTVLTGTWDPCVGCSMDKGHCAAMPKTTKERCKENVGPPFIDLSGPKSEDASKDSATS